MSHNVAHYSLKYGLIGLFLAGAAPLQAAAQSAPSDDTVINTERRAAQQALASGDTGRPKLPPSRPDLSKI